jgi:hypothetical protein
MSGIFSTDINVTPCIFGNIRVFKNSEITPDQLKLIHGLDLYYTPRCNFLDNLTLVHPETKTIIQVDANLTLFDVMLPPDQEKYKELMFNDTVNYIITTIRSKIPYTVVNEAGFKISFYAPVNTPASNPIWWDSTGITKMDWKPRGIRNQSTLGMPLSTSNHIYTLYISVDSNYILIKNTEQSNTLQNTSNTLQNNVQTPYFQTPPISSSAFSWDNAGQNNKLSFGNGFQSTPVQSTPSTNGFQFSSAQPSASFTNGFQPPVQSTSSNTNGFQFPSTQPSASFTNGFQPPVQSTSSNTNGFQFSSTQPSTNSTNGFQPPVQSTPNNTNGFQFSSTQPSTNSTNGFQFPTTQNGVNPFLPTYQTNKKW